MTMATVSSRMLHRLFLPPREEGNTRKLNLASSNSIGGSNKMSYRFLQPRQGRRVSSVIAVNAAFRASFNQVGRFMVGESVRSTPYCHTFMSSIHFQQYSKRNRGRICNSKPVLAEKDRPGKGSKPRRRLRLRGRLRLLMRYVRRGLGPPAGFSWKPLLLGALVTCTFTLVALFLRVSAGPAPQNTPYSDLIDHIHARTVTSALFEEGSQRLLFNVQPVVKEPDVVEHPSLSVEENSSSDEVPKPETGLREKIRVPKVQQKGEWQYVTRRVRNDEAYLLGLMREKGVRYSSAPQSVTASIRSLLITIVSLWIPLSPLVWLLHRQISGNNSTSQKRRSKKNLVNFTDVAGIDTAKAELAEIVACLRGTSNYASLGAKLPKGVLLVGPPGTGKTLLARAVAGEAGVPFFSASASEFVEMFVGRGAARIRELFAEAKKNTPSIVFIDELDAVGGKRGRSFNDERDQTLNQLLTEMDGFDSETGVMVIAATNRPEVLDAALTRPGRISRRVNVDAPDFEGRQQVLAVHMRSTPVDGDAATVRAVIAKLTPGFVGADLANVVNEAALLAAREGRPAVTLDDFKEAVIRAKYGVGDNRKVSKPFEDQLNQWFSWVSKSQPKQLRGSKEPPAGYRTVPYNG
ncbi:probable inactive ATP-dependent zinc metalloprotease FTSHI 3, chloroplastic [Physcomitrium patens]|uniref:AAA+ ATPase domain-containing protein n=1 Tax=Physcomitrium patens TaxID=3218 RepID=A0A2K1KPC0_PHYPA|nr:probable inactive ATP-dependent zinc metalloprotease FTSHI 3, chloroplastic [Physcomitrium patens]PNR55629.1 hypothetical protein PHYPA_006526 [Physcomitrium patens]|eukprot:XP_024373418.1 probable inactive ATP-dependent zinc metalloprotease FTSHI 3, chloroplastic [Physcomitrella patens]